MSLRGIGRGWAFPLRRDPVSGRPQFSSEEDRIFESIHAIVMTDIDERPHMVRNGIPYGTRIKRSLFSGSQTVIDVGVYDIRRALEAWEPRIQVTDVKGAVSKVGAVNAVVISIRFVYRADNRPGKYDLPIKGVEDV